MKTSYCTYFFQHCSNQTISFYSCTTLPPGVRCFLGLVSNLIKSFYLNFYATVYYILHILWLWF